MSRLSKKPIAVPQGTEVSVENGELIVRGKGGTLRRPLHRAVSIAVSSNEVVITATENSRLARALSGTYAAHIRNMLQGVNQPFTKRLQVEGIGFRAELSGKEIKFMLGFSHPVMMKVPDGLTVQIEKNIIVISGSDKEHVGQFAASIRSLKKPEPYKGKGIRYEDEVVRRKEGKKAVASAG